MIGIPTNMNDIHDSWYTWHIYIWWHCYMHQVPWNYLLHSMVFNLMLNCSEVTIHYMMFYHVKWYTGPQKEMQTEQTEPFWHTVKFLSILFWCNLLPLKNKVFSNETKNPSFGPATDQEYEKSTSTCRSVRVPLGNVGPLERFEEVRPL